jgi:hypothetical protein
LHAISPLSRSPLLHDSPPFFLSSFVIFTLFASLSLQLGLSTHYRVEMLSSLLYLATFASYATSLAFVGPHATSLGDARILDFPLEPTTAPKAHLDLFRRQNVVTDLIAPDNTCGYISGLAGTFLHNAALK